MNEAVTWILIANSSRARVVEANHLFRNWKVVEDVEHPESRMQGRNIMADDRGRTAPRDRESVRRAAMTPKTDAHDVEVDRFGREVVEILRAGYSRNAFGHLALVAPPGFLGRVRAALPDPIGATVRAEVTKNLVDDRLEEVLERVRPLIWPS